MDAAFPCSRRRRWRKPPRPRSRCFTSAWRGPQIARMLSEIEQLLILQDRDRKIRSRRVELTNAPLERKGCEQRLASAEKAVEAAKLKGKEIEVERKKLENEAEAKRGQIAKFQTQKFQTRKNEEFQALNHEIERFEKDIQSIED